MRNLEIAMEHLYKLPERFKFEVKGFYYAHTEEYEKRLRLTEMRIELFPEDIDGYLQLAYIYGTRNQWDQAVEQYHRALEIAPEPELHFHSISYVYRRQGDLERAREYMERYVEHFPDDAESYVAQGRLLDEVNDHAAARASYEKALLLDPGRSSILIDLGDVERNLGHVEVANELYAKALARGKRPEDRAEVYERLEILHRVRGQSSKAIEYFELEWQEREKVLAPRIYALQRLLVAYRYVEAGREEAAWQLIEKLGPGLEAPFDQLVPMSYLSIYLELGDVEKAEEELVKLEAVFEARGDEIGSLKSLILRSRGEILEAKGDFVAAIESYHEALEIDFSNRELHLLLGRAQSKTGRYRDAIESLEKALAASSFDPEVRYELALAHAGLGDDRKAREHMERAVEMWSDADPGYAPAVEARARLAQLDAAA